MVSDDKTGILSIVVVDRLTLRELSLGCFIRRRAHDVAQIADILGASVTQISVTSDQPTSAGTNAVLESVTDGALSKLDSQLAALHLSRSSAATAAASLTAMV